MASALPHTYLCLSTPPPVYSNAYIHYLAPETPENINTERHRHLFPTLRLPSAIRPSPPAPSLLSSSSLSCERGRGGDAKASVTRGEKGGRWEEHKKGLKTKPTLYLNTRTNEAGREDRQKLEEKKEGEECKVEITSLARFPYPPSFLLPSLSPLGRRFFLVLVLPPPTFCSSSFSLGVESERGCAPFPPITRGREGSKERTICPSQSLKCDGREKGRIKEACCAKG